MNERNFGATASACFSALLVPFHAHRSARNAKAWNAKARNAKLVLVTLILLATAMITVSPASADARPVAANDELTVSANEEFTLDFCANDIAGDGATTIASTTTPPAGTAINGCELSGATAACEDNLVWYFIRDEDGDGAWGRIELFVDCSNIDRVPVPKSDLLRNFFRDQPGSFDLCANDDLGDQPTVVTYSTTLPDGLSRDGCIISGIPTVCAAAANFFYWLEDANGDRGYTFATVQVRCTPKPEPDSYSLTEGEYFQADVCVNDYLADEPTTTAYSVNLPPGLTVSNCLLSGTPRTCGQFTSFYWIRDRDSDRSSTSITLDIECVLRPTSSVLFFDDTTTANGWTVNPGGSDTATNGQWELGNPGRVSTPTGLVTQLDAVPSGTTAWITGPLVGTSSTSHDVDGGSTSVRSEPISIPIADAATLEFDWYFAHDALSNSSDRLSVQVTGPGGTVAALDVRATGQNAKARWRHHAFDLAQFAGQEVRITVTATDGGPDNTVEAAFDNMEIRQVPIARTAGQTPGPLASATASYKLAPAIQPNVRPDIETELWGRIYHPVDLSEGPYPLVMVMHGNHFTCGTGPFPRLDNNNQYATTGTCPSGYAPVPSHEGYSWLAEPLAKAGHIVVSVNTNRGINGLPGLAGDEGLVEVRGRLLLEHLAALQDWSTTGGAPASLGLGANGLVGAIDFGEVAFVGHSRGGEAVRAAYNLFDDASSPWPAQIPGLEVKAIAEIAPVDQLGSRVFDVAGVPWLGILPMCDLDEPEWKAYEVLARSLSKTSENPPSVKALYAVWGADHNGYNTQWHQNDTEAFPGGCFGEQNWQINDPLGATSRQTASAVAGIMSLIQSSVGEKANADYLQALDPTYSLPPSVADHTLVERTWVNAPGTGMLLDSFTNTTGFNSSGQANQSSNLVVNHVAAPAALGLATVQPAAELRWANPGGNTYFQSNWAGNGVGRDVSETDMFEFRIGRTSTAPTAANPNFSIRLAGADGSLSDPVQLHHYATVWPMAGADSGPGEFDHPVMQSVRIPLGDFGDFDLTSVRGVRFTFDDNPGAIFVATMRFASGISFSRYSTPGSGTGGTGDSVPAGDSVDAVDVYPDLTTQIQATQQLVEVRVQRSATFPVTSSLPTLTIGGFSTRLGGLDPVDATALVFLVDPAAVSGFTDGMTATVNIGGETLSGTVTVSAASAFVTLS